MTKRFLQIINLLKHTVSENSVCFNAVADVGCDHGLLSKYIIEENLSKTVIAIDISLDSIKKTKELIKKSELESRITTLCCDGLTDESVKNCEIAIIAGLGGVEITKIILDPFNTFSGEYILMPHSKPQFLRKTLNQNGYKILSDYKFYDYGFFYDIMRIKKGHQKLKPLEIEFGLTDLADLDNLSADFSKFFNKKYSLLLNTAKNDADFTVEFLETLKAYNLLNKKLMEKQLNK